MQHPSRIYPHDYYEEREKQQEVDGLQNIYHFVFGTAIEVVDVENYTIDARQRFFFSVLGIGGSVCCGILRRFVFVFLFLLFLLSLILLLLYFSQQDA